MNSRDANAAPTFRLWLMMVLEFVIWGAWLPLIWGYMGTPVADGGLGFSPAQIAWVGSAFAIASIVGIFFSSQFADRTFAAERFMARATWSAAWRCSACSGPRTSPRSSG